MLFLLFPLLSILSTRSPEFLHQGAIADLRQAAKLFQQQNKMEDYQKVMNVLKKLGVSN